MPLDSLEARLQERMQTSVELEARGLNDYRVHLPFTFADGDELKIILKRTPDGSWDLTDEGNTLMFLSYYDLDLSAKNREAVISRVLKSHFMENRNGRFVMSDLTEEEATGAVFTFAQGLLAIGDLAMWKRERKARAFINDFKNVLSDCLTAYPVAFDYHDEVHDPDGNYIIDSLVTLSNSRAVHIYGVNSDLKAERATNNMYYFEKINDRTLMCAIYAPLSSISSKTKNRLGDIADKTLSSLEAAKDRLPTFVKKWEAA